MGDTTDHGPQARELLALATRFDTRALVAVLRSDLPLATAWARAADELRQTITDHP